MNEIAQKPGIHQQTWSAGSRRYVLSIPETFDPEQPLPLVIALHWSGQVTRFYGKAMLTGLIGPGLAPLGALIAAPDCPGNDWSEPAGVADVIALLDRLNRHYPVDARRTLLCGYSMGGIGTWYIGARHQDRFAALLPMAAVPPDEVLALDWKLPLYAIHSRNDELFDFARARRAVTLLRRRGVEARFTLLEQPTHFNTGPFLPALRAAVPWIHARFDASPNAEAGAGAGE